MLEVSELLKKVRLIEIVANRAVNDFFSGQYKSVFRGRGMEFSEVREYQAGDDIRSIDWNVTARAGKPFIKRFIEERELTILFLIDISASGIFGTHRSKIDTAIEVAATLMFSALKNNDKVGLVTFADQVINYYRPRKGKSNVLHLIRELLVIEPVAEQTDLRVVLDYVNRVQKRRAVIFMLSDFIVPGIVNDSQGEFSSGFAKLDKDNFDKGNFDGLNLFNGEESDSIAAIRSGIGMSVRERHDSFLNFHSSPNLQSTSTNKTTKKHSVQERAISIASRKHDVVAMRLFDLREKEFPNVGFITIEDAETGELVELDTANSAVRELLKKEQQAGEERINETLRRCRVDQMGIETSHDYLTDLLRFFKRRENRY
ncbi:MAG: DUF58 domain-containing protein [Planctomycetaceae bacterium]|jgi:uncharacterized protein (DUF58 family)|nr:DUF58 domain-containing protein [Planctomycetaceae bacterium]